MSDIPDKIDPNKKYQTKHNRSVEILRTDMESQFPVVGIVTESDGSQEITKWTIEGNFFWGDTECDFDLVEIRPAVSKVP